MTETSLLLTMLKYSVRPPGTTTEKSWAKADGAARRRAVSKNIIFFIFNFLCGFVKRVVVIVYIKTICKDTNIFLNGGRKFTM